jgi:hypothetical protein
MSPSTVPNTVAIDKIGTNRRNAPILPTNRAPEEARKMRMIIIVVEQA